MNIVYVCVEKRERDWERCSPEASQVKCALYRQMLYIIVYVLYVYIPVWGKCFSRFCKVEVKTSWETTYTTSHIHNMWFCHKSVYMKAAAYDQVFLLKLSNSIHATSFINLWWERKSPKTNRQRHCFSFQVISDGRSKLQSVSEASNERSLLLCGSISHSVLGI